MAKKNAKRTPSGRPKRGIKGSSTALDSVPSKDPQAERPVEADSGRPSLMDYIAEQLRPLAVPIADLVLDPANARRHPEANIEALKGSLAVYGQLKPIVVNRRNNVVEAGNGTLEAARALGWSHLAVVYVDHDPATAAGFSIADNRTAELATWDEEALRKLMAKPLTEDPQLARMLDELGKEQGIETGNEPEPVPEPQIDRAAELQKKWGTKCGQLWEIPSKSVPGKCHRLLCGDSTKAEDVERVMGGEKAGLVLTDPPYGIAHKSNGQRFRHAEPIAGDLTTELAEYARSLAKGTPLAMFFSPYRPLWGFRSVLVWDKGEHVGIGGDRETCWKRDFELIGVSDNRPLQGKRESAIIRVPALLPPPSGHFAEKPVELLKLLMHKLGGESVLDPFAGSGPTFCAAEQLARLCYGLEIEPKYVAVTLERLAGMGLEPRLKPPA